MEENLMAELENQIADADCKAADGDEISEKNSEQRKRLEMMDALCRTGIALEELSRMCFVLRLGFESPDFCDGKDASACMRVLEQLLEQLKAENVDRILS